jgi:hypothetical protein
MGYGILLLPFALVSIGLAGWLWRGWTIFSLVWMGLIGWLGVCGLFHFCPRAAPAPVDHSLTAFAADLAEESPVLKLVGGRPWLVLAVASLCASLPSLIKWSGRDRGLPPAPVAAPCSPPKRPPPRLIRDLPAEGLSPGADRSEVPVVDLVICPVGPLNVGKSEMVDQLCLTADQVGLRSPWNLAPENPRLLNELQMRRRHVEAQLHQGPRETTLHGRTYPLILSLAGRSCLRVRVGDPVGQLVSKTILSSDAQMQNRCDVYQKFLGHANVIWMTLSCPRREASASEIRWFRDNLQLTMAYARAALDQRPEDRPCTLAVVVTRIDVRYTSEADARARMPREILAPLIRRLAPLCEHRRLDEAVIIPVSAWGFGRGVAGTNPKPGLLLGGDEKTWLLRPGVMPVPFNLNALVRWSLAAGVGCMPASTPNARDLAHLRAESANERDWIVPLSET